MKLIEQLKEEYLEDLLDTLEEILVNIHKDDHVLFVQSTKIRKNQSPLFQILYNPESWEIQYNVNKSFHIMFNYDALLGLLFYKKKIMSDHVKEKFYQKVLPTIISELDRGRFKFKLISSAKMKEITDNVNKETQANLH